VTCATLFTDVEKEKKKEEKKGVVSHNTRVVYICNILFLLFVMIFLVERYTLYVWLCFFLLCLTIDAVCDTRRNY